jgi:hypothetical protein
MDDYSYNKQIEVPWVLTHYIFWFLTVLLLCLCN